MIYTLIVECVGGMYYDGSECVRVIEIDEDSSLEVLHGIIQQAVDFDDDHLYDFYAGRHSRNQKVEFEVDAILSEIYPLPPSCKLYYLFDYGDSWVFQIRKSRKRTESQLGVSYPRIIKETGKNPTQYPRYEE